MRKRAKVIAWIGLSLLGTGAGTARAQEPEKRDEATDSAKNSGKQQQEKAKTEVKDKTDVDSENSVTVPHTAKGLGTRFLLDQKQIWTSPARLRFPDANWLLPLSGVTAGMFVTDADMSRHISQNKTTISHYNTVSNATVGALIGGAGAMWLLSYPKHEQHWRETGFLAGEAVINSFVVVEAMKYPLGRQRPFEGDRSGTFFKGGVSFPSEHAAAAWAVAGVVAHEYPGPLTKIIVYSLASLVDYSRYRAHQHFPSDVFIGTVIGNLVAQDIYSRHHDVELGGAAVDSFRGFLRQTRPTSSANMGSPYVPLDSWVYPAMDRLIALGYIQSAIVDMRPWTRFECARLVGEASESLADVDASTTQAGKIYKSLAEEFGDEIKLREGGDNTRARMESVYTRFNGISGKPLSQGYNYDFGQTVINDSGRPYEEGFNNVTGFSGWATESHFTVYASGEFQHAPSAPPLTASARQQIAVAQELTEPPGTPISQTDRFQWLDAYVGMNLENWQISFGKQSLWWGPGAGGPMMFSNNAAPINMFRVNRVSPFKLPSVLGWLGPMRVEFFLGQVSDHYFISSSSTGSVGNWSNPVSPQPMISGERFSFKPTPNLEFGFALTALFAGQGVPFTTHTYLKSIFGIGNGNPGTSKDPGDRRSGFDLSYRLPFLRNFVTFYADGFADDQFSPVAYWDRSSWTSGLYISHLPKIPKLDLRFEGSFSDVPAGGILGHGFFYWNDRFVSGYINQGNLIGSWIGRDGQGAQAWANYWFTAKNRIQFNFRHEKVSQQFLTRGGSLTDVGARGDIWLWQGMEIGASVQYERWLFPVIQPGAQRNFSTSIQIKFQPQRIYKHSSSHGPQGAGSQGDVN